MPKIYKCVHKPSMYQKQTVTETLGSDDECVGYNQIPKLFLKIELNDLREFSVLRKTGTITLFTAHRKKSFRSTKVFLCKKTEECVHIKRTISMFCYYNPNNFML